MSTLTHEALPSQTSNRRLSRMEKAMDELATGQRSMAEAQQKMADDLHNIQSVVSRLQEADLKHASGLQALAEHNTDALQTFKGMLEAQREAQNKALADQRDSNNKALADQRDANDKALASLTETLTNKALEQIQANMVSALFRRVTDWLITLAVAAVMFGASWVYTHVK